MPDSCTQRIYTEERAIQASAAQVYGALVDFGNYPQWNPWLIKVKGEPVVGSAVVAVVAEQFGGNVVKHQILQAESPSHFVWCDLGWFTRWAGGQRSRQIQPINEQQCSYRCELRISGPLAWAIDFWMGAKIRAGMAAEADALQRHCAQVNS